MTPRKSAFTTGLAVLLVAAAAGCRGSSQPASASLPSRPLALMAPGGSTRTDQLIATLQKNLRRAPRSPEAWVRLGHAWARKARELSDPGLYRSAAGCVDAALELAPGHRPATALRGLVLLDAHRFDEARRTGEQLLEADREDLAALRIVADASVELGRFDEAVQVTQRMVDLKPSLPSYARASYLRWLTGDVAGALEAARLAIDAGGDAEPRAWMLVQTALMFWHRGDLDGADAGLDAALAQQADYAPALAGKGRVALSRGDPRGAAGWLERAWARAPLPETAWLLGDARQALGDEAGAGEAYERVVRNGRAFDHRTLALFYATKGREPQEAVRLVEQERTVRDDLYTEDAYAWALYRAGRIEEARAAADRAMALGTRDARLLYHAGAIRLAHGDGHAGRALIGAALALNPTFDLTSAAEARRALRSTRAAARVSR